jgi:hypothetical protein
VVDRGRSEGERVVVFISQGDKVGVAWLLGTDVNFNTPESISLPPPFHTVFLLLFLQLSRQRGK